jgi:hypothetical protein
LHLPVLPAEYERTCADCGHTWRVPRAFARRRFPRLSALILANNLRYPVTGGLDARLFPATHSSAAGSERETFRHCPRCGSEQYAQRPAPH